MKRKSCALILWILICDYCVWNVLNQMEKSLWYEEFAWELFVGFVIFFYCCWQISNDFVGNPFYDLWFIQKILFLSYDIKLNHTFSLSPSIQHLRVCDSSVKHSGKFLRNSQIIRHHNIPLQYCYLARVKHSTRFLSQVNWMNCSYIWKYRYVLYIVTHRMV